MAGNQPNPLWLLTPWATARHLARLNGGSASRAPVIRLALGLVALLIMVGLAPASPASPTTGRLIAAVSPRQISYEQTIGPVERPAGLAVTGDGHVYVVDSARGRVNVFAADGSLRSTIGLPTFGAEERLGGQLTAPLGIAIEEQRELIYVSDLATRQISQFSFDGTFRGYFATDALSAGTPGALFLRDDRLYVCDLTRNEVLALSTADGALLGTFGASGTAAMDHPNGVWVDPDGTVLISDSNHNRIQEFTPSGRLLSSTALPAYHPRGLALDDTGRLWIAATLDHKVIVLTPEGRIETELTAAGGQELGFPTALAISNGRLFVTDRAGKAVQVWRLEG